MCVCGVNNKVYRTYVVAVHGVATNARRGAALLALRAEANIVKGNGGGRESV